MQGCLLNESVLFVLNKIQPYWFTNRDGLKISDLYPGFFFRNGTSADDRPDKRNAQYQSEQGGGN
jgi:hypothetical protein